MFSGRQLKTKKGFCCFVKTEFAFEKTVFFLFLLKFGVHEFLGFCLILRSKV